LPSQSEDFGLELLLEFGVGFDGIEVVVTGTGGEIGTLEAIDFGVVLAAEAASDSLPIGLL
jgi:hypothetical protein